MERPKQHVTDGRARLLAQTALPSDWVVRWQGDDYGIDGEFEVFVGGQTTGTICKIQLKGRESPKIISRGRALSLQLSRDNLDYYINQLTVPVVVLVADTTTQKVWWHFPQISSEDQASMLRQGDAASVSLRIDASQLLPSTIEGMLKALGDCIDALAARRLRRTADDVFVRVGKLRADMDEAIDDLQLKLDIARFAEVEDLLAAGKINDMKVNDRLTQLVSSTGTEPNLRFVAAQLEEWVEIGRGGQRKETLGKSLVADKQAEYASRLLELAPRKLRHLRLTARLNLAAVRLHQYCDGDFALFMQAFYLASKGGFFDRLLVLHKRTENLARLIITYRRCIRLVKLGVSKHPSFTLTFAIARFIAAMGGFVMRQFFSGEGKSAESYRKSMFGVAEVAGSLARHYENWQHAALIALNCGLMINGNSVEDIEATSQFVQQEIALIDDASVRASALQTHLQTKEEAVKGASADFEGEVPPAEETLMQFQEVLQRYYS